MSLVDERVISRIGHPFWMQPHGRHDWVISLFIWLSFTILGTYACLHFNSFLKGNNFLYEGIFKRFIFKLAIETLQFGRNKIQNFLVMQNLDYHKFG